MYSCFWAPKGSTEKQFSLTVHHATKQSTECRPPAPAGLLAYLVLLLFGQLPLKYGLDAQVLVWRDSSQRPVGKAIIDVDVAAVLLPAARALLQVGLHPLLALTRDLPAGQVGKFTDAKMSVSGPHRGSPLAGFVLAPLPIVYIRFGAPEWFDEFSPPGVGKPGARLRPSITSRPAPCLQCQGRPRLSSHLRRPLERQPALPGGVWGVGGNANEPPS